MLQPGDTVQLAVHAARRRAVMRNHSATHLLHAALRQVLGEHVRQAGSLVAPDRLRFDFQHPAALSQDAADEVERLVNAEVLANIERRTEVKPFRDAVGGGAIAFFGDKYGERRPGGLVRRFLRRAVRRHARARHRRGRPVPDRQREQHRLGRAPDRGGDRRARAGVHAGAGPAARGIAARLRVPVDQLPQRVDALTARNGKASRGTIAAASLAGEVATTPSGQRYVIAADPGIGPASLAAEARRLSRELDAVAVLLLPDAGEGSLRVGVSVPRRPRGPSRPRRAARTAARRQGRAAAGAGGDRRARRRQRGVCPGRRRGTRRPGGGHRPDPGRARPRRRARRGGLSPAAPGPASARCRRRGRLAA